MAYTFQPVTGSDSGYIYSSSALYSGARSGSSLILDTSYSAVGQHNDGGTYTCYETFLKFDTSSLSGLSITDATLSIKPYVLFTLDDFDIIVAIRDYGSLSTTDWVPGTSLSGLTEVARVTASTLTAGATSDFTSSALAANINTSDYTRLILFSNRLSAGTTPSSGQRQFLTVANTGANFNYTLTVNSGTANSQKSAMMV